MKILHAAETIKGGIATVMNSLIEYQTEQTKISKIICLIPSDQEDNLIEFNKTRIICFKRNGRNILGFVSFFFNLINLILKEKPDILHLHSSFAGLFGRLAIILTGRRTKTKIIYCPHAFSFLMETNFFKLNLYLATERFLSIFTDKIICVGLSEYNTAINKGFDSKKLVIIHNGVKLKKKVNTRKLNNKNIYKILFIGRFDYQKGIDILAEAIQHLTKSDTNTFYEFTLIGETVNSKKHIIFEESKYVKVNQLGWLQSEQLEEKYLTHDVIIIPSRWEGFAMVPLEAMSYGVPIIASDIEPFKELETNSSQNYITFFKANSSFGIFKVIYAIKTIELEQNRSNMLIHFKNNFSYHTMNSKTLNLYDCSRKSKV